MQEIKLIQGDISIDDRGQLSFVNNFDFKNVKRFYMVENHFPKFIRAWHGHKDEGKYVFVAQGAALLAAVKIDNWAQPSKTLEINKFVLSSLKPQILYIPPGYANGFMTLSENSKLIFYSTSTLEQSKGDDYRFESRYWNPWDIAER